MVVAGITIVPNYAISGHGHIHPSDRLHVAGRWSSTPTGTGGVGDTPFAHGINGISKIKSADSMALESIKQFYYLTWFSHVIYCFNLLPFLSSLGKAWASSALLSFLRKFSFQSEDLGNICDKPNAESSLLELCWGEQITTVWNFRGNTSCEDYVKKEKLFEA